MPAKRNEGKPVAVDPLSSSLSPKRTDQQLAGTKSHEAQPDMALETYQEEREVKVRLAKILSLAKAEILASGHFLTPDNLASRLNLDASALTVWLAQAEAQQRIFSVEYEGQIYYPSYAFSTCDQGALIQGLLDVLTVLHSEKSDWDMAFWFRSPNTFLGGKRPEDILSQNLEDLLFAAHQEVCSFMPG